MIYLDSSVVLARLLAESRRLPDSSWHLPLISSRLLQYEVWNRLHARAVGQGREVAAQNLLNRIVFVELTPAVLARALEPFPIAVRTLDSLHLATMNYLRGEGQDIEFASFDERLLAAASALGIAIHRS
jgi:predicted nucleic acid-binding protein